MQTHQINKAKLVAFSMLSINGMEILNIANQAIFKKSIAGKWQLAGSVTVLAAVALSTNWLYNVKRIGNDTIGNVGAPVVFTFGLIYSPAPINLLALGCFLCKKPLDARLKMLFAISFAGFIACKMPTSEKDSTSTSRFWKRNLGIILVANALYLTIRNVLSCTFNRAL